MDSTMRARAPIFFIVARLSAAAAAPARAAQIAVDAP
jgi:hypothetical protein